MVTLFLLPLLMKWVKKWCEDCVRIDIMLYLETINGSDHNLHYFDECIFITRNPYSSALSNSVSFCCVWPDANLCFSTPSL